MKKLIGVLLIVAGIFILLSDLLLVFADVFGILPAIVFFAVGVIAVYSGIKRFKPSKSSAPSASASKSVAPDPNLHKYSFKVAGISYRQRRMVEDLGNYNYDYDMSKKQLIDDDYVDEKIYKYTIDVLKVELIDEPDNKYDPGAIMVIADGTHIGYVPKEKTGRVREILSSHDDVRISCEVYGGDYKILEEDDDGNYSVEKVSLNYGAEVTVTYRETVAEDV